MEYLSDSDPENSLPLLPYSAVDVELLSDFFAVASRDTRERLRRESTGTPLQRVFDTAALSAEVRGADPFRIPSSSPQKETYSDSLDGQLLDIGSRRALPTDPKAPNNDEGLEKSLHSLNTLDAPQLAASTALPSSDPNPPKSVIPEENAFARPSRSLRRRTFASMHPYIADQADYLEICSIDSMNEMFSAESDLAGVVKTLNNLYLRKKKRYPDEDRYNSANFYIHLSRSKVMALQGISDSQVHNTVSSSQLSDENFAPEKNTAQADEEILSSQLGLSMPQSPDFLSELNPNDSSSDEEDHNLRKTPRVAESVSGSSSESESTSSSDSEPEQMIRIGGRYRKLSKILRGVLPESAKRLSMFQSKEPSKKRKTRAKELVPRKGLAHRKFGSTSIQSAQLEDELKLLGESDAEEVRSTPIRRAQSHFPLPTPTTPSARQRTYSPEPLITAESSSGDESDVGSDAFSEIGSPLFNVSRLETTSFEADIEPLYLENTVSPKISRSTKKIPSRRITKRKNPAKKRIASKLPKKHFDRSTLGGSQSGNILKAFSTNVSAARNERVELNKVVLTNCKVKPKAQQLIGRFTSLDYKRAPTASTFVYEVESANRFVRKTSRTTTFNIHRFNPTKEALFANAELSIGSLLLCACDFLRSDFLSDGYNYFPGEDSVTFTLLKKRYTLGLYQMKESREQVYTLLSAFKYLLNKEETYLNDLTRNELSKAIIQLMKWLIISRDQPTDDTFSWMTQILNVFSKVQVKEVRRLQIPLHGQLLFVHSLLCKLQAAHHPDVDYDRQEDLQRYTLDYWLEFFLSFLADELRLSEGTPQVKIIYNSIHVVQLIFRKNVSAWWLSIVAALSDVLSDSYSGLIDLLYVVCSQVPHTSHNWAPFLTVLTMMRRERVAEAHNHYIDACIVISQRLGWPLEEKVLISLYSSLAYRKFANFDDEEDVPPIISGAIRSVADIPDSTVFERFLVMIYRYVAELDSEREVKRLISKILPSSALEFHKGRHMRIIFVNRINLILLLSQISTIDLSTQFSSTIALIADSQDQRAFDRAVDAISAYSEMSQLRHKPLPIDSMVMCMNSGAANTVSKTMKVIGGYFQAEKSKIEGACVILRVLNQFDLNFARDSEKAKIFSLLMYAMLEIRAITTPEVVKLTEEFQKRLLTFISGRMSDAATQKLDLIREVMELSIQLWNLTAQIIGNRHWNVMMFQKYLFMGNEALRDYFICLFALEFLQGNKTTRDDDILNIDKIFVRALCAPNLDHYILGLFTLLSKETRSMFQCSFRLGEITSLFALLANQLHILDAAIRTLYASTRIPVPEKTAFVVHLLDVLNLNYNKFYAIAGYPEMCKHIMDTIRSQGKSDIKEMSQFWVFADKLGYSSASRSTSWDSLSDEKKMAAYHCELEISLQYESNVLERMEGRFPEMEMGPFYTLLETYIMEMVVDQSYYAHISFVLTVILRRLNTFKAPLKDGSLMRLVRVIRNFAMVSNKQSALEAQCFSNCALIIDFVCLLYDGYREQEDIRLIAGEFFKRSESGPWAPAIRQFPDISVKQLNLNKEPEAPTPQQIYTSCTDRLEQDHLNQNVLTSMYHNIQTRFLPSHESALMEFELIF